MNIIPVLDLMNGQVVHAKHGNRHQYLPIKSTLTSSSEPHAVVSALMALYPFKHLYIADINAIQKNGNHNEIIHGLLLTFPMLTIWLDAGFDALQDIQYWEAHPIKIVLGSESLESTAQYRALFLASKGQAILSLDYKDDQLLGCQSLAHETVEWPQHVIVMTLNKVGSHAGPDNEKLIAAKKNAKQSCLYAAGGVRNVEDLNMLKALGIDGALVASALHSGSLTHHEITRLQS